MFPTGGWNLYGNAIILVCGVAAVFVTMWISGGHSDIAVQGAHRRSFYASKTAPLLQGIMVALQVYFDTP